MKKTFLRTSAIICTVVMVLCSSLSVMADEDLSQKYKSVSDSEYDIDGIQQSNQQFTFDDATAEELIIDANKLPVYADKTGNAINPGQILKQANTAAVDAANSFGAYPRRKGVILVTADKYKGLIPTGHAAIIWTTNTVVESLSGGVTTGVNNWNRSKKSCYGVTTYGTTAAQDSRAANYAYAKIGKPYNWNYVNKWTRNKFYCSQLVYAAYLDLFQINLDTAAYLSAVHPMELVNSSKTYTIYQK
ncbi:MAG: hypothetical protein LBR74_07945 [Eubacterium sp.]|jgi:uncharacterized protein YycO|nr:hypothetical protein [Eubacterium sp.]